MWKCRSLFSSLLVQIDAGFGEEREKHTRGVGVIIFRPFSHLKILDAELGVVRVLFAGAMPHFAT